jgi:hypothetical protein
VDPISAINHIATDIEFQHVLLTRLTVLPDIWDLDVLQTQTNKPQDHGGNEHEKFEIFITHLIYYR